MRERDLTVRACPVLPQLANQSVVTAQHQEEQSALINQLAPGSIKTKAGEPHPREATSSRRPTTQEAPIRKAFLKRHRRSTVKPPRAASVIAVRPRSHRGQEASRGDCVCTLHTRRILCGAEAAVLRKSRNMSISNVWSA